ncbi:NAD-dependent epimerase/dehydratase family protein [Candidatus Pelagibacter sp. HIMB1493]|uniref:NAD-dependent epimerase/dehydratase family protein n=1 Tax=Candidatus Pelagibacter sp. HIMB1493 TaxID=3413334 RepID=UPI003F84CB55
MGKDIKKKIKKILVVTGGAGFVGSNLIELLLKKTKYDIISIDNYSSGSKQNHFESNRVKYITGNTKNISLYLNKFKKKIVTVFHFGEFSRIYQSFLKFDECYKSNTIGTQAVFKFCLDNRIKIIYSATSASLGNNGNDKNLSPYAFSKSKNLELLENLRKWFNLKFEIIYFYNVYGPRHIQKGDMATVIGIFENNYKKKKPLPVVKPGSQTRRFTHINDTVNICYEAWKNKKCCHYSISHKKYYSIIEVAKMFNSRIKFLKSRPGERYASALTKISQGKNIIQRFGRINLKDYVTSFIEGTKL